MQLGEAQQFAGALIRMSQLFPESDFYGFGGDTEVERRAHLRIRGWLTDRA